MSTIRPDQLRRRPARPHAHETVARILSAADRLLVAEGAAGLNTKRVAEAAGVAVGTVYNWFPDKEAIAEALALRAWGELSGLVADVAQDAEAGSVENPLAEAIGALVAGLRTRPGFLALWFGELRTERLRDATRPYRYTVSTSVERILAVAYPETSPTQRATVARMTVLIGDGLLREAFRIDINGDETILSEGRRAITAYVDATLA
jgi:AcrR family transcriptional regulator